MNKLLELAMREIEELSEGDQNAAAGVLLDYVKHRRAVSLTDDRWQRFSAGSQIPTENCCRLKKCATGSRGW